MEIIFELLLGLAQVVAELLLQFVFELLGGILISSLREPFRRPEPVHPVLAAFGYALLGGIAGIISLWLFPSVLIEKEWLRIVNLIVTPLAAGAAMAALGAWRRRRDKPVIRLDRFGYGFLFALAMSGVRFAWGK
jgi:hypothetical protein